MYSAQTNENLESQQSQNSGINVRSLKFWGIILGSLGTVIAVVVLVSLYGFSENMDGLSSSNNSGGSTGMTGNKSIYFLHEKDFDQLELNSMDIDGKNLKTLMKLTQKNFKIFPNFTLTYFIDNEILSVDSIFLNKEAFSTPHFNITDIENEVNNCPIFSSGWTINRKADKIIIVGYEDCNIYCKNIKEISKFKKKTNFSTDELVSLNLPTFTLDGKLIVSIIERQSTTDLNFHIINADTGKLVKEFNIGKKTVKSFSISSDGKKIVYSNVKNIDVSDLNFEYEIFTINMNGTDSRLIYTTKNITYAPIWSPDGEFVLFSEITALQERGSSRLLKALKRIKMRKDGAGYVAELMKDINGKVLDGEFWN